MVESTTVVRRHNADNSQSTQEGRGAPSARFAEEYTSSILSTMLSLYCQGALAKPRVLHTVVIYSRRLLGNNTSSDLTVVCIEDHQTAERLAIHVSLSIYQRKVHEQQPMHCITLCVSHLPSKTARLWSSCSYRAPFLWPM